MRRFTRSSEVREGVSESTHSFNVKLLYTAEPEDWS